MIRHKFNIRLSLLLILGLTTSNVFAQYWKNRDQSQLKNSVNIGLNTFHTSSLYLNYGRMILPQHELVIGIPFISLPDNSESGFSLNYRYHFKAKINSLFAGVFYNYSKIDGIVTESEYDDGELTSYREYPYINSIRAFGLNVGKKWVTKPGICLTARIGYGFNRSTSVWDEEFDDEEFMNDLDRSMEILGHIDFELTLGYAFNFIRK